MSNIIKRNKKYVFLCKCIMQLCIVATLCVFVACGSNNNIATLNGEKISVQEVAMYAENLRASVAAKFSKEYGITEMGQNFWSTEYNGVTPYENLFKQSLEAAVHDNLIRAEAQRLKIDTIKNYTDLKNNLADENKNKQSSTQVNYGPQSLALSEYNNIKMQYCTDAIKAALLQGELAPTKEQLEKAFDELDDEIKQTGATVFGVVFTCSDSQTEEIKDLIAKGIEPVQAAKDVNAQSAEEFTLNNNEIHREDITSLTLFGYLSELNVGEFLMFNNKLYYLSDKTQQALLTVDQAPRYAEAKYINDAFDKLLAQRRNEAKLDISKNAVKLFISELEKLP